MGFPPTHAFALCSCLPVLTGDESGEFFKEKTTTIMVNVKISRIGESINIEVSGKDFENSHLLKEHNLLECVNNAPEEGGYVEFRDDTKNNKTVSIVDKYTHLDFRGIKTLNELKVGMMAQILESNTLEWEWIEIDEPTLLRLCKQEDVEKWIRVPNY